MPCSQKKLLLVWPFRLNLRVKIEFHCVCVCWFVHLRILRSPVLVANTKPCPATGIHLMQLRLMCPCSTWLMSLLWINRPRSASELGNLIRNTCAIKGLSGVPTGMTLVLEVSPTSRCREVGLRETETAQLSRL